MLLHKLYRSDDILVSYNYFVVFISQLTFGEFLSPRKHIFPLLSKNGAAAFLFDKRRLNHMMFEGNKSTGACFQI